MNPSNYIFVGTNGQVAAVEKSTGQTLWKTKIKGGFITPGTSFVTLLVDGDKVFAHTSGELFCLDAASGQILWTNDLPQMGYMLGSLATAGAASSPVAEEIHKQRENSAAAGASAATV